MAIKDTKRKPYIVNPTAKELQKFLADNNIKVLNVAGNRGSKVNKFNAIKYTQVLKDALRITEEYIIPSSANFKSLPKRTKPKSVNIEKVTKPKWKKDTDELEDDCLPF